MASPVTICNAALSKLGANPITSLQEGTLASTACLLAYEQSVDALLRLHTWNFATKRTHLAETDAPLFEYSHTFVLPSDFIRVLNIYGYNGKFKVEGLTLLTNRAAPLQLVYIANITDPNRFDPLFIEALQLMIANKIANRIRGEGFNTSGLIVEYDRIMLRAQMIDEQEASVDRLDTNSFDNPYWYFT